MKTLMLCLALLLSFSVFAQNEIDTKNAKLRVFDLNGKRMAKGKVFSVTDSTMTFTKNGISESFRVKQIGSVRINRRAGHNILIPAAISAGFGGLMGLGIETDGGIFQQDGATAAGFFGGAAFGAAIGLFTLPFKKPYYKFEITGDQQKWDAFIELLQR